MVGAAQRKPTGQADERPPPAEDQREQIIADALDAAQHKPFETDDPTVAEAPVSVKVCFATGPADPLAG